MRCGYREIARVQQKGATASLRRQLPAHSRKAGDLGIGLGAQSVNLRLERVIVYTPAAAVYLDHEALQPTLWPNPLQGREQSALGIDATKEPAQVIETKLLHARGDTFGSVHDSQVTCRPSRPAETEPEIFEIQLPVVPIAAPVEVGARTVNSRRGVPSLQGHRHRLERDPSSRGLELAVLPSAPQTQVDFSLYRHGQKVAYDRRQSIQIQIGAIYEYLATPSLVHQRVTGDIEHD